MKPQQGGKRQGKIQSNGAVVCDYLEQYPDLPSRTIARLILKECPTAFSSLENCRSSVRSYRGNHGKSNMGCGKYYRPPGNQSDGVIPLPPPLKEIDPWRIVPIDFKRALLLYDIHIPYHDADAVQIALRYGRAFNPDCIILGGDLMDFHSLSSWERDPRQRDAATELHTGERFLEVLRDRFPKARILFLEGNHEQRIWRFVWRQVPEFAACPEFSLRDMLHLDDYGIECVDGMKPLKAGEHLHILHGHEFGGFMTNPVNPARGLFLRAKVNAICGHFHQTSQHTEPGLGHPVSTYSSGALCSLHPTYRPINKWNHGFVTVEMHRQQWSVRNHKIIKGEVV